METQPTHKAPFDLPPKREPFIRNYGFSLFAEAIVLRTNSPELAEVLAYYLGLKNLVPVKQKKSNRIPSFELWAKEPINDDNFEAVSFYLVEAIHKLSVALNYRFLFIHGCAFSFENEGIVFCGPSGSGKTTLSMVAHHLGYSVFGEDLVAIDWKKGRVYPLLMPFHPRPFTRRLLKRWYTSKGKTWEEKAPVRPRKCQSDVPFSRLFLTDGKSSSNLDALLKATFGRNELAPDVLIRQITSALANCRIEKCPQIRIQPDVSEEKIGELFKRWMESEKTQYPIEMFGNVKVQPPII